MSQAVDTEECYTIGRSVDCKVIPNATDKPIQLWMHHFHAMALIVNKKTGDICTQFFNDGAHANAQTNFDKNPERKLQQDIFLEQEGEKVVFLFNTNYKTPNVEKYINDLQNKHIEMGGIITADATSFPDYEKYKYGEIPVGFQINLNDPRTIQVLKSGSEVIETHTQTALREVGKDPSTLPDMEAVIDQYYYNTIAARMIARADTNLPDFVAKHNINLKTLGNSEGRIGQAIVESMRQEQPFAYDRLYDDANIGQILDTLTFVRDRGLDAPVVALLAGIAAEQTVGQIFELNKEDSAFPRIYTHAQNLMAFAKDLVANQPDDMAKQNCIEQMRQGFDKLNTIVKRKVPDAPQFDLSAAQALPSQIVTEAEATTTKAIESSSPQR